MPDQTQHPPGTSYDTHPQKCACRALDQPNASCKRSSSCYYPLPLQQCPTPNKDIDQLLPALCACGTSATSMHSTPPPPHPQAGTTYPKAQCATCCCCCCDASLPAGDCAAQYRVLQQTTRGSRRTTHRQPFAMQLQQCQTPVNRPHKRQPQLAAIAPDRCCCRCCCCKNQRSSARALQLLHQLLRCPANGTALLPSICSLLLRLLPHTTAALVLHNLLLLLLLQHNTKLQPSK